MMTILSTDEWKVLHMAEGIDDVDREILRVLNKDARFSYREIAQMTELSVGTVSHRIKRMEEKKVIKGYIPQLDPEKVGFDLRAIVFLEISKGKLKDIEEKIVEFPNIVGVYDVTGEYDAIIIGRFTNRQHLNEFVKQVQTMKYVERTITSVVLNALKENNVVEL